MDMFDSESFFITFATAISKSSCVTCSRRSLSAYLTPFKEKKGETGERGGRGEGEGRERGGRGEGEGKREGRGRGKGERGGREGGREEGG